MNNSICFLFKQDGEQALQSLHKQCLPFILRRLKAEVLTELPEKIVQDRECELSLLQRHLYKLIVEFCSLNVKGAGGEEKYGLTPIQVLHALRKLVDHPFLIAKLVESLKCEDASFNKLMEQCKKLNVEHSGKMLALRELLAECGIGGFSNGESDDSYSVDKSGEDKPLQIQVDTLQTNYAMDNNGLIIIILNIFLFKGSNLVSSTYQETTICRFDNSTTHKALIFCQWRATIDLVSHFLKSGAFGAGFNFLVLDGQTPLNQRQSIVDRFNTDPNLQLLLLTTHVGGIGLNLTGADVIIFVDHDWNPFRDLQAIDRAHRLGQNRTVNVFRLITLGTVEEKVMKLQQFKEDTANALIGVENRSMASMATDELLELFSLKCPESNLEVNLKVKKVKKSRMNADASCASETGVWAVDELWGGQKEEAEFEQYIEQHSVQKFLHSTIR
ncbi:hypothetical protein Mgra_00009829 [Meloidogyne graminicola]|uniref:Helicase C-terminal domain-containing protein n=1 Tax=Meloidogyne graminicola TaxID=189291 RepID=A0A8S9ZAN5_9BILA|nr:hypothetical protein Mgra_00009829 [Meloidogyne graminicola]